MTFQRRIAKFNSSEWWGYLALVSSFCNCVRLRLTARPFDEIRGVFLCSAQKVFAVSFFAFIVSGCGGDGLNLTLAPQDIQQVFITFASGVGTNPVVRSPSSETINCSGGGTVVSVASLSVAFSSTVTFAVCEVNHYVVTGRVTVRGPISARSSTVTVQGELTVTGTVLGTCPVFYDVMIQYDSMGNVQARPSGAFCGRDVTSLRP